MALWLTITCRDFETSFMKKPITDISLLTGKIKLTIFRISFLSLNIQENILDMLFILENM